MTLTVDQTPTRASASATSATTGSFTPGNNSILVAVTSMNTVNSTDGSTVVSGGSLTWTQRAAAIFSGTGQSGATFIHTAPVGTGASMTVATTTTNNNATNPRTTVQVYVLGGYDTLGGIGFSATGGSTTNNLTTTGQTSQSNNGLVFAGGCDRTGAGAPTSSDLTITTFTSATFISCLSGYKTTGAKGSTITTNMDAAAAAAAAWSWAVLEIIPAYAEPVAYVNSRRRFRRAQLIR